MDMDRILLFVALLLSANTTKSQCPSPSGHTFPDSIRGEWMLCDDTTQSIIFGDYGEMITKNQFKSYISFVRLERHGDTTFMVGETGHRTGIRINGDYLEVHPYRKITGVLAHGNCYVRCSCGPQPVRADEHHIKIIVPAGFSGRIAIALDQKQGAATEYDEQGNIMLKVPQSGLLESQAIADGFAISGGRYRFYVERDGRLEAMPHSSRTDRGRARLYAEPLVGIMCGFNAGISTDAASKMFGKEIVGEVLIMSVLPPDEARRREAGILGWVGPEYGESPLLNGE